MTTLEREELIDYAIYKLTQLQIKADFEDKKEERLGMLKRHKHTKILLNY